ncbi:MAG: M20/M25/M40 family metallo-hydrolase [Syntrophus sp. (in: bacteria)]
MNHIISGIEPVEIWGHFYKLTQIPHPSGEEKAICKYVYRLAEDLGMEVTMDTAGGSDFGNILVKCPPSPGCEKAPITILQSHLDMVALPETNKDLHLDLILDGSMLRARGNTLGADNGIAVAMALSLMTNPDIVHGPLELLFTTNEEAGMTGVRMLSDRILAGIFLINIDTQEEGLLTVASAGANRSIFRLPVENAIPSEAHAVALIRPGDLVRLREALQKWEKALRQSLANPMAPTGLRWQRTYRSRSLQWEAS